MMMAQTIATNTWLMGLPRAVPDCLARGIILLIIALCAFLFPLEASWAGEDLHSGNGSYRRGADLGPMPNDKNRIVEGLPQDAQGLFSGPNRKIPLDLMGISLGWAGNGASTRRDIGAIIKDDNEDFYSVISDERLFEIFFSSFTNLFKREYKFTKCAQRKRALFGYDAGVPGRHTECLKDFVQNNPRVLPNSKENRLVLFINEPRRPMTVSWGEIGDFIRKLNEEIQKNNDFFLSRAYIPEQALFGKHQILRIDIVRGYFRDAQYYPLGTEARSANTGKNKEGDEDNGTEENSAASGGPEPSAGEPAKAKAKAKEEEDKPEPKKVCGKEPLPEGKKRDHGDGDWNYLCKHYFEPLSAPAKLGELRNAILRAGDLPGMTIKALVAPAPDEEGKDQPGAAQLYLDYKKRPAEIELSVDNYGSDYVGPVLWSATARLNGPPFFPGLRLAYTHINDFDEANYAHNRLTGTWMLQRLFPFMRKTKLLLNYSWGNTKPGHTLNLFDIESKTNELEVGLRWTPFLSQQGRIWVQATGTQMKTDTTILDVPYSAERLRILRGELGYACRNDDPRSPRQPTDSSGRPFFLCRNYGSHLSARLGVSQGIDPGGWSTQKGSSLASRTEASPDYLKANFDLAYTGFSSRFRGLTALFGHPGQKKEREAPIRKLQRLAARVNYPTRGFFKTRLTGQWTDEPLFASEEIRFGGRHFGRGYSTGQIMGDRGVGASLELGVQITHMERSFMRWYGFFDHAHSWNVDKSYRTLPEKEESIDSYGFGFQLNQKLPFLDSHLAFTGELAWPGSGSESNASGLAKPYLGITWLGYLL